MILNMKKLVVLVAFILANQLSISQDLDEYDLIFTTFETDSLVKYNFKNRREFKRDYREDSPIDYSKVTKEWGHYHISFSDSFFSYHKMGEDFVEYFRITDKRWELTSDGKNCFYLTASNGCGNIFIKLIHEGDVCYMRLYWVSDNKISGLFMQFNILGTVGERY
jgi:hypothetical protein